MEKPGIETSEYKQLQNSNFWNNLGIVLSAILTIGPMITERMNQDSKAAIIAGAIIGISSILSKTLTMLGYTKSRTDVKKDEIAIEAKQIELQQKQVELKMMEVATKQAV